MHVRWGLGVTAALVLGAIVPPGDGDGPHDARSIAGRIAGQLAALFLLSSIATTYRGRARWATSLHISAGLLILLLVIVHLVLLLSVGIARGWLSGLLALGLLAVHGWLGARKRALLRARGPRWWRAMHLWSGWGAVALAAEHALLFGRHWGLLSDLAPS